MTQVCTKCGQEKVLEVDFVKAKGYALGYARICRKCGIKNSSAWIKRNPEKVRKIARNSLIFKAYGLTDDQYSALLSKQGGVCAICSKPETSTHKGRLRMLAVDHDHETGAVRGLLCVKCNTGLGHFQDSTTLLHAAARYLTS